MDADQYPNEQFGPALEGPLTVPMLNGHLPKETELAVKFNAKAFVEDIYSCLTLFREAVPPQHFTGVDSTMVAAMVLSISDLLESSFIQVPQVERYVLQRWADIHRWLDFALLQIPHIAGTETPSHSTLYHYALKIMGSLIDECKTPSSILPYRNFLELNPSFVALSVRSWINGIRTGTTSKGSANPMMFIMLAPSEEYRQEPFINSFNTWKKFLIPSMSYSRS
ncbi:hypothetical protein C8J56DRAFT_1064292 [Mycena floridula]|nr:hypothetical protein C8J56DRAFT_1064292 [Mycena floridula]